MSIVIVDYKEPSVRNISDFLDSFNITSLIISPNEDIDFIPDGIILSGGPHHVQDKNHPKLPKYIFELNCPVLGICYGMQILIKELGGTIKQLPKPEIGEVKIYPYSQDPNFIPNTKKFKKVWMNHSDEILKLPRYFQCDYISQNGTIASATDNDRYYTVMYHPEVKKPNSNEIRNPEVIIDFISICNARFNTKGKGFLNKAIDKCQARILKRTF